ncbi:MAG: tetratricopeptide repeat protein [Bacteroidetes bacterium]|jgi:tetratricopeptide (TPR) repeat protein|nr:tetratricopeptide repeat protein [Bacteroidota bacterium]
MDELQLHGAFERARAFAAEGRWLHAIQVYRSIFEAVPESDDAVVELGSAYAALGQIEAAERLLNARASASETPEPFLFILGTILFRAGRSAEAQRHFMRVLRVERKLDRHVRARLHYFLGAISADEKKWSVADHHLRTVLSIEPNFPRLHESLAEVLLHRGRLDDAEAELAVALREEPMSWMGHYLSGLLATRRRRWEEALSSFTQAVDIDPKNARGWHRCGEAFLALHRLNESERYLRKALELNPSMIDAVVEFGYLALQRGDREAAEELFERALQMDPGHHRAQAGVRTASRRHGRGDA